jgi:hypothetical protein
MYIGDTVRISDKRLPFEPLEGVIEAINNNEIYVRIGFRGWWIDRRRYEVEVKDDTRREN